MSPPKKWVTLGKIVREWGIRGQVRFKSYHSESHLYPKLKKIYLRQAEEFHPYLVERVKPHGRFWLFKLEGFENPESAKSLRGREVALLREELPKLKKGEFYLSDLEGFKVQRHDGQALGEVRGFIQVGGGEVMVIRQGGKEFMIPYREDFVEKTSVKEEFVILKESAEELL